MTVIATGFEEAGNAEKAAEKPAAAPAAKPQGLFSGAAEKAAAASAVPPPIMGENPPAAESAEPAGEDPFDSIFKIFNTK